MGIPDNNQHYCDKNNSTQFKYPTENYSKTATGVSSKPRFTIL